MTEQEIKALESIKQLLAAMDVPQEEIQSEMEKSIKASLEAGEEELSQEDINKLKQIFGFTDDFMAPPKPAFTEEEALEIYHTIDNVIHHAQCISFELRKAPNRLEGVTELYDAYEQFMKVANAIKDINRAATGF